MSAAFERGEKGYFSLYVPTRAGGLVQRSTGTRDRAVVRGMQRMVSELRDRSLLSGSWVILDAIREQRRWTPPGGKQKRFTLRDAYAYYASNALSALEGLLSAKNLSDHLDGWKQWVVANRQEGVGTPDVYWQQVTTLIPAGGVFPATELTKARVVAWLAGLTCSSGTRRKYRYALGSFVHYLLDVGVLETDPLAGLKAPKKNPARERWETVDRDRAIVAAAIPKYRAFFAFVKAIGCDVGSARRAQLGDLNLAKARANVRGTKTDRRAVHAAEIEAWAIPILAEHVKGTIGAHTLLFPGITNSGAGHHHEHACAAVGVKDYTLKDSRHSIGVRMRLAGRTFEEIAAQLGTSVFQAVTVYTKYKPEDAAAAQEAK